jgi:hypothetical protein
MVDVITQYKGIGGVKSDSNNGIKYDAELFLANLQNDIYKEYKQKMRIIQKNRDNIRMQLKKGKNKKKDSEIYYKETRDYHECYLDKIYMQIYKPEYINIDEVIERLKDEKEELMPDYSNLKYSIIYSLYKDNVKQVKAYETIVGRIKDIDENIEELIKYKIEANKVRENERKQNEIKLRNAEIANRELLREVYKEKDAVLIQQKISVYIEEMSKMEKLKSDIEDDVKISYAIIKLPRIIERSERPIIHKEEVIGEDEGKRKTKRRYTPDEIDRMARAEFKRRLREILDGKTKSELNSLEGRVISEYGKKLAEAKSKKSEVDVAIEKMEEKAVQRINKKNK